MKNLVFASHNAHKVKEINQLLEGKYNVQSLAENGFTEEIEETGSTLTENALLKARCIYSKLHGDCFADDTGLEVDALGGRPGVYSARYAGEPKNDRNNILLLLQELQGIKKRTARFKTVIALIIDGKEYLFEGVVEGSISDEMSGDNGFGYDPVFIPAGYNITFAEMSAAQKNDISHRAIAVRKLADFLCLA
jgi:XTP/dITP diphosphohydrolase